MPTYHHKQDNSINEWLNGWDHVTHASLDIRETTKILERGSWERVK